MRGNARIGGEGGEGGGSVERDGRFFYGTGRPVRQRPCTDADKPFVTSYRAQSRAKSKILWAYGQMPYNFSESSQILPKSDSHFVSRWMTRRTSQTGGHEYPVDGSTRPVLRLFPHAKRPAKTDTTSGSIIRRFISSTTQVQKFRKHLRVYKRHAWA